MYVPTRSRATAAPSRTVPTIEKRRVDRAVPTVVNRVLGDPRVQRAMRKHGIRDMGALVESIARPVIAVGLDPEVRRLENKLAATTNIMKRVELERDLAFAKASAMQRGGAK